MPELPEVESVRLSLLRHVVGKLVRHVRVNKPQVIVGPRTARALLVGQRIARLQRHGKQLAFLGEADDQPCLVVGLGMTGSLVYLPPGAKPADPKHVHVIWEMEGGGRMVFRDPRRFGRIHTLSCQADVKGKRWAVLGPDALRVTPRQLWPRLTGTRRAVKAALLDQRLVAGLGNIYVDESLFAAGIAPTRPGQSLSLAEVQTLVRHFRRILKRAIAAGGSSVRDYRNGLGQAGRFQLQHAVYGRSGETCRRCGSRLITDRVGGRTTVYCGFCQK